MNEETQTNSADCVERRIATERNTLEANEAITQRMTPSTIGLDRVREAAQRDKKIKFNSLLHHLNLALLVKAYHKLNPKAATGIDQRSWKDYGKNLLENLKSVHNRLHRGTYRASPSKRLWIAKADGSQRPLGLAAIEDKIVQQALAWTIQSIYEADFKGFSYGFRPQRKAHDALDAIYVALHQKKVSWILDADITGFFDAIQHDWMITFLEHRISDRRILRLIKKFLRSGVEEEGRVIRSHQGTPQGAVISPLLANIYLHYVLDLWVAHERKRTRGEVYIVRYADDFVMGFQYKSDAENFQSKLKLRLQKFGLELHAKKTRLIEFGRFAQSNRKQRGAGKPESFDFLGFTHICSSRRSDGKFSVKRISIRNRVNEKLKDIKTKLYIRMHDRVSDVGFWLRSVVNGYYNYHAIPGNHKSLSYFRAQVCRSWLGALRKRSQKSYDLPWYRCRNLFQRWVPSPRVRHPYPNERFSFDSR